MALSDLSVYSEYAYTTATEILAQQIELFNGASRGAISLGTSPIQGDYSDQIMWQKISGLVRRRNAYGTGSVSSKKLTNLVDTMVKVAAGTPPVEMNKSQFTWIQMNPAEAGVILGKQLAVDSMADMLNTAIMSGYAALAGVSDVVLDVTGATDKKMTPGNLNLAAHKFGDRAQDIVCWLSHSATMASFYGTAITNANLLFNYGSINVNSDPFGRVFIVSDSTSLVNSTTYYVLGLVPGAITVNHNGDYDENWQRTNGDENILTTYQAEWTYNLGIKGFAWDKTNGGASPADGALATSSNWDKYATSVKDIAGVVMKCNA